MTTNPHEEVKHDLVLLVTIPVEQAMRDDQKSAERFKRVLDVARHDDTDVKLLSRVPSSMPDYVQVAAVTHAGLAGQDTADGDS